MLIHLLRYISFPSSVLFSSPHKTLLSRGGGNAIWFAVVYPPAMGCGVSKDNHPFYGIGSNADKESKDMKKRSGPKKKRKRKAKKGGKGARKNSHETTNGKHQAIDLGSGFSHTAELTNFLDKETIYKVEEWLFDAAEDIEFQKQTVPGRSVKRPSRPTISPMDRSRNKNVHHLKRLSIREFTTLVPDTLPRTARQGSDALSSNVCKHFLALILEISTKQKQTTTEIGWG